VPGTNVQQNCPPPPKGSRLVSETQIASPSEYFYFHEGGRASERAREQDRARVRARARARARARRGGGKHDANSDLRHKTALSQFSQ
jgi:hypothetical protein